MKIIIRYCFRAARLILTPIMLLSEKLTTPSPLPRSPEEQHALDQAADKLALYQFKACPFCIKVRKELARQGLNVETRDARNNPDHRTALQAGGGKLKVPCLLIQHDDGQEEWLYESTAINSWLQARFG
ncbi:glutaredoxin family protein [Marinimicrobium alkaliphilum]|uniref:glutaredoxin family protein n=1 Tax=Marinimicrobium alkaliphilum TaxID=2202654 RepID=UPI000DB9C317|nr:glutaredoxin [Marinimicrobium alkaliphilum]